VERLGLLSSDTYSCLVEFASYRKPSLPLRFKHNC
jgi:hypothetical protein